MAPIGVGSTLPDGQLAWFDESDQLQQVSISSLAAGKKVILFGVPGAFTPTCSMQHVPGFVTQSEELKAKGVDEILLVSGHGHAHPWPGRTGKGRYLNGGSKLWMLTAAAASGRRCGRQQHVMDCGIRVHAGGSSAGMSLSLSWTLRRSRTGVVARSGGHAAWEGVTAWEGGRGGSGIAASGKGAVVEEAGRGGAPGASIP